MKKLFNSLCILLLIVAAVIIVDKELRAPEREVFQLPQVSNISDTATDSNTQNHPSESSGIEIPTVSPEHSTQSAPPKISLEKYKGRYCYQLLTGFEADLYLKIAAALDAHDKAMQLEINEAESIKYVLGCVLSDFPEYYWVQAGGTLYTKKMNNVPVSAEIKFAYTMDAEQRKTAKMLIDQAAERCLAQIDPEWSDYEKVKAVYDYIVLNTVYDKSLVDDQTLYSVLVLGNGVCTGYAKAAQYLLNQLGISCVFIDGEIIGKEGHAWNLVKVEGEFYYLDPTWGDSAFSDAAQSVERINYDYFCITTADIRKTHAFDDEWQLPQFTATAANYFIRNGFYFHTYDFDSIAALLDNVFAQGSREAYMRFSNQEAFLSAIRQLFEQNDIFRMLQASTTAADANIHTQSISYSQNDDLYILKLYFQ